MALVSLLYISTSCLAEPADAEIERILTVARHWNPILGVTGALLFTGQQFAQCIEGPEESTDQLLERIKADHRHRNLVVVERLAIEERRFSGWSLAYAGPSLFVKRTLQTALIERTRPAAVPRIIRLLQEFAA